jgi:hypothetical protein
MLNYRNFAIYWGVKIWLQQFMAMAPDGDEWSVSWPSHFTTRERPDGAHWTGYCGGSKTMLDSVLCQEWNLVHWLSSPQPSHYTKLVPVPQCSKKPFIITYIQHFATYSTEKYEEWNGSRKACISYMKWGNTFLPTPYMSLEWMLNECRHKFTAQSNELENINQIKNCFKYIFYKQVSYIYVSVLNPFWSYVEPRLTVWFSCSAPMSEDVRRFSSCSTDFSQQIAQAVLFLILHVFLF